MRAKFPYRKKRKRIGRGVGSDHGKTSTKGHKGHRARSGFNVKLGFEGGQNPLYRRLPKRGFNNNAFRKEYATVNVEELSVLNQKEITPESLVACGFVKQLKAGLKVLGKGDLKKALTVKAHKFSQSAKDKIEKAGGQALLLEN